MRHRQVIYPFISALCFAGSFIAAKYATADFLPLTTAFLRYVVALAFLTLFVSRRGWSSLKIDQRDLWRVAVLGLTGIAAYHFLFFASLKFTELTNTAIINASSPVITGILAAVFIKERLTRVNYFGVLLGCCGVLLLITRGSIQTVMSLDFNIGDLLMLGSVNSWAVYAIIVRKMLKRYDSFTLLYHAAIFGVLFLLPFAMIENPVRQWQLASAEAILGIIYMGVFASGIGYYLYNLSIREIGPTKTSSFVYSGQPILVALGAYAFFADSFTAVMAVSALLVIVSLHFVLRPARTR